MEKQDAASCHRVLYFLGMNSNERLLMRSLGSTFPVPYANSNGADRLAPTMPIGLYQRIKWTQLAISRAGGSFCLGWRQPGRSWRDPGRSSRWRQLCRYGNPAVPGEIQDVPAGGDIPASGGTPAGPSEIQDVPGRSVRWRHPGSWRQPGRSSRW